MNCWLIFATIVAAAVLATADAVSVTVVAALAGATGAVCALAAGFFVQLADLSHLVASTLLMRRLIP